MRRAIVLVLVGCQGGRPAAGRDDARPAAARATADAADPVVPCPVPRTAEGALIADEVNLRGRTDS